MKILSLDQSLTHTAWVVWEDGVIDDFGVLSSTKEYDTHVRILELLNAINYLLETYNIELLVLEGLSFGSISISVRPLAGLYYGILIECFKKSILWEEVTPSAVKKFATGSGRAKKKDMWEAVPASIKVKFEKQYKTIASGKYDLADAYFIGAFCLKNLGEI